jgi:hypothetical protein
VLTKVFA